MSNIKKKTIGLTSAVFLGISSMIGSGWLFAPYKAATVAGPASIISWIIGSIIVWLLAMCFSEIASLYPRRGLSAIIPTLSHNKYFGFPFAIANWLGIVAVIALEADATIEYLINLAPHLKNMLYFNNSLTIEGDGLSVILVILFCMLNFWGAKMMVKTNNVFGVIKLVVPLTTIIMIISASFHTQNFTVIQGSLVPYGYSSIFTAILSTGIIVAFNGFQTVISFSSEIKRPHINIPLSITIAVIIALIVYALLQVTYIGGIPVDAVKHGWNHLHFNAPMVQLSGMLGLGLLTSIIYFGATFAPCGTGIAFAGTSTRMFTAMARNEQMPKYFNNIHPVFNISRRSLIMNMILVIVFLMVFRSWSSLAQVLSLFHIISYLPIPIALYVFRRHVSAKKYPFRVRGGYVIAPVLFTLFTYLFSLANPHIVIELFLIFAVFQIIFILINAKNKDGILLIMKQCAPLLIYFIGLVMLTIMSPNNDPNVGPILFACITIIFSLAFFFWLTRSEKEDVGLHKSIVNIYHR